MILPTALSLAIVLCSHSAVAEMSEQASAFSRSLVHEVKSKNLVSVFDFTLSLSAKKHASLFVKTLKSFLPPFGIYLQDSDFDLLHQDVINIAPHLTPEKLVEVFGNTFGIILDHYGLLSGKGERKRLSRQYANILDYFRISKNVKDDPSKQLEAVAETFRMFLFSVDRFDKNTFPFEILTYRDQAYVLTGVPDPKQNNTLQN